MFESRYPFEPTAHAMATPRLPAEGLRRGMAGLKRDFTEPAHEETPKMKLASLKGPTRDGTLVVVNRDLAPRRRRSRHRAHDAARARELGCARSPRLLDATESLECGNERHAFDFQAALAKGQVAAPLPRAYEWLDGSAYLSHVRARAARAQHRAGELPPRPAHVPGRRRRHDGPARPDPRPHGGLGHRPRRRGRRDHRRRPDGRHAARRPPAHIASSRW